MNTYRTERAYRAIYTVGAVIALTLAIAWGIDGETVYALTDGVIGLCLAALALR